MPAAEMKHGPIALINEGMPVVFLATRGQQYDKVISNIEEVRARGGKIIAVATEGDMNIRRYSEHVVYSAGRGGTAAATLARWCKKLPATAHGVSRGRGARVQRR